MSIAEMIRVTAEDLRDSQMNAYMEMAKQGAGIVYLVSDSVSTSKIRPFRDRFPEKVINVGIAEQNLMGMAAGLANSGLIPITGNASPFLVCRSNEQLKVDISYSQSNVKVNGLHAGFSYGTDGITHHELNDVSVLRGMPGFEIYVPCDPRECRQMAEYGVLDRKGPVYTSLNSGKFPLVTPESYVFRPGYPVQFSQGADITIVALGSAVHDALDAAELLGGYASCEIFAITSVRPFFPGAIIESIRKTGLVLTVEQHTTHGGAGSMTAELIAENGLGAVLKRLGVPEGSFSKNWTAADNKVFFKLDPGGIRETVQNMLS
ncbi:MAG: transketolase family protein [Treponema sp.]|jgi:transketolase|nr:transketolase family protein [Treponema sp.]